MFSMIQDAEEAEGDKDAMKVTGVWTFCCSNINFRKWSLRLNLGFLLLQSQFLSRTLFSKCLVSRSKKYKFQNDRFSVQKRYPVLEVTRKHSRTLNQSSSVQLFLSANCAPLCLRQWYQFYGQSVYRCWTPYWVVEGHEGTLRFKRRHWWVLVYHCWASRSWRVKLHGLQIQRKSIKWRFRNIWIWQASVQVPWHGLFPPRCLVKIPVIYPLLILV